MSHIILPIRCLAKMRTREDADRYRQLLFQFDNATNQLMRSVDKITDCQERIRSICEARKNELENYTIAQIGQLGALKTCILETVREGAESVKAQLMDDSFTGNSFAHLVWQASRSNVFSQLSLFEYKVVPSTLSMLELMPVEWQSKATSEGISADYSLHSPEYAVKAEISRLREMEFPSMESLMGTCGRLASQYHEAPEIFVNAYTEHYFAGSKIVEETMKHSATAGIEREEWVKLQCKRFEATCSQFPKSNYDVFKQQLIAYTRKAFDADLEVQRINEEKCNLEKVVEANEKKIQTLKEKLVAGPFSTSSLGLYVLMFLAFLLLMFRLDPFEEVCDAKVLGVSGAGAFWMIIIIVFKLFTISKWRSGILLIFFFMFAGIPQILLPLDISCGQATKNISMVIIGLSVYNSYRCFQEHS